MSADAVILAGLIVTAIGTLGAVAVGIGNLLAASSARHDAREEARLTREEARQAREAAQAAAIASATAQANIQASTDVFGARLDGGLEKLTDALEKVAEARGREAGRLEGKKAAEDVQDRVDIALATPAPMGGDGDPLEVHAAAPLPVIVVGQTEPVPVIQVTKTDEEP